MTDQELDKLTESFLNPYAPRVDLPTIVPKTLEQLIAEAISLKERLIEAVKTRPIKQIHWPRVEVVVPNKNGSLDLIDLICLGEVKGYTPEEDEAFHQEMEKRHSLTALQYIEQQIQRVHRYAYTMENSSFSVEFADDGEVISYPR